MKKLHISLMAAFFSMVTAAPALDTNSLKTDLGVFETQTGTVLIKGFSQIGLLTVGSDVITVRCKETSDVSTGHKADGLAIEITRNPLLRERILVDYAEIDSLLDSINYLNKISYDVTPLAGFEASYTTKAGLRVAANSVRKQGIIQASLEYDCDDLRILLTTDQMTQFYRLIEQARKNLDAMENAK